MSGDPLVLKQPKVKKIRSKDSNEQVGEQKHKGAQYEKDHIDSDVTQGKKTKKRQHREVDDECSTLDPDLAAEDLESKKKKKKKKNKHRDEGENAVMFPEQPANGEKKEKKKRKCDADQCVSEKDEKKKRRTETSSTKDLSSTSSSSAHPSASPSETTPLKSSTPTPEEISAFLAKHSIKIHTPPNVASVTPILSFAQLDIPSSLRVCLSSFKEPTPVQACTWPLALQGRDLVGIAETGSGKTLAFGIPALARLISSVSSVSTKSKTSAVTVLVIAPTRELAIQTHDTLSAIGAPFGIASVAVFGGVPKEPQARMLRKASKGQDGMTTRIVVGTPGRILDLVQEQVCDLSGVDYLVLDEADRMLEKGFENDIRNIISHTKQGAARQTMMFSATWPDEVRRLASTFQQNPIRVTVGSDDLTANSKVEQIVEVFDDARSKDGRLTSLLRSLSHKKTTTSGSSEARILIFTLFKKEAARVELMLKRQGYSVGALHGDLTQSARMDTLEKFRNGTTGLMVATDVAARGLDIANVGVVINYTFPLKIEDYIHRIGRTGRGGQNGKSITFFTGDNNEKSLAGELARVLREGGFQCEGLRKFPMTIKKKAHSAYGAFYRDDIPMPKGPTKIVFA